MALETLHWCHRNGGGSFVPLFYSHELRSDRRSSSALVQQAVEQKETLQKLWNNFAETLEQLYSNFLELYAYKVCEK